jgi:hypothetical protein
MTFTVKGIKGLAPAFNEFASKIGSDIADRTITANARESKARLEQDTPVITGRLVRSTVIRKEGPNKQVLGQFAPYSNVVNNRRGYWSGAIQIAQKWPQIYAKAVSDEWGIMGRKYGGT